MVNIWQRYLEQHEEAKILLLIYPSVSYNGKEKYRAAIDLWSLFADTELVKSFLDDDFSN